VLSALFMEFLLLVCLQLTVWFQSQFQFNNLIFLLYFIVVFVENNRRYWFSLGADGEDGVTGCAMAE